MHWVNYSIRALLQLLCNQFDVLRERVLPCVGCPRVWVSAAESRFEWRARVCRRKNRAVLTVEDAHPLIVLQREGFDLPSKEAKVPFLLGNLREYTSGLSVTPSTVLWHDERGERDDVAGPRPDARRLRLHPRWKCVSAIGATGY